MSHSIGRTYAADEVRLTRRRIVDRIKALAKLKLDAEVYRLIRVPPGTARTALFQRPDVEIALVDDLRRAKNRLVEIDGGGSPYRTLRGMKGHEILSLPLSKVTSSAGGIARSDNSRVNPSYMAPMVGACWMFSLASLAASARCNS